MKRHFPGLAQAGHMEDELPEGTYLVEAKRIKYRWHPQKPFFSLTFEVLAPTTFQSRSISGRLYCTVKALWKLHWFLKDFGYDPDLLVNDDIDEKAVVGLKGIVRLSHRTTNGRSFPSIDAFAPAERWAEEQENGDFEEDASAVDDREAA